MSFKTTATIASFGGKLLKLTHNATSTGCEMSLNLYLPPQTTSDSSHKVPVVFYLAGLTCTGDNGAEKGFFQYGASQKGIAIVYPDTSPRGLKIAGEDESWDFGSGAGFYLDATQPPWNKNYKMHTYITSELPGALWSAYPQLNSENISIMGHSMGGYGALVLFLKNPGMYKSVSAFSPIANPINCPWGEKAFIGYLGDQVGEREEWKHHDPTELIRKLDGKFDVLIDVGTADNFYKQGQLLPENFAKAAKESGNNKNVNIRYQEGYDHSYFFISTFATDHINYHAKFLLGQ